MPQQMALNDMSKGMRLLLICTHSQLMSALPLEPPFNSTEATVGWVSGPSYRSTMSIITSCILTMGLCVWSAMHLNIPSTREGNIQYWLRTIKWVLIGIFGPELVVFAAWRQYVSARAMQSLENTLPENSSEPGQCQALQVGTGSGEEQASKHTLHGSFTNVKDAGTPVEWTVVHGFYAAMGGFVFELDSTVASALCLPNSEPYRLTITPRGLKVLAQCGLLPAMSEKDIRDKSKADGLAKTIVCLQAGWMVLQTVVRLAFGLPVTLFEVNTIGHVVCAVLIYALWWHKPRLIHEPTVIRGRWVPKMAAYLWLNSQMSEDHPARHWLTWGRSGVSEQARLAFVQDSVQDLSQGFSAMSHSDPVALQHRVIPCLAQYASKPAFGRLGIEHTLERVVDCSGCEEASDKFRGGSQSANIRWMLALEAASEFVVLRSRMEEASRGTHSSHQNQRSQVLVVERAENWPSRGLLTTFRGVMMGMALWFASIAFGAIHIAAWNDFFPSELEAWLWRASSLDIVGSGLVWMTINFLGKTSKRFDHYWDEVLGGQASRMSYVVLGILCSICGLAYGLARIFLVVESIISLRQLPVQAYVVPNWSLLIPHL